MKKDTNIIIIELLKLGAILLVAGAAIGALYAAEWKIEYKIIVFAFLFFLAIIANELARSSNGMIHMLTALSLIFMQLNLMGKKQGIKESTASDKLEDADDAVKKQTDFQNKLIGYNMEVAAIIISIVVVIVVAAITAAIL